MAGATSAPRKICAMPAATIFVAVLAGQVSKPRRQSNHTCVAVSQFPQHVGPRRAVHVDRQQFSQLNATGFVFRVVALASLELSEISVRDLRDVRFARSA